MNQLIFYPLLFLIIIAGFNQVFSYTSNENLEITHNGTLVIDSQGGTIGENGSSTTISTNSIDAVFDINATTGIVALIIGLIVVGVVAGIRVLGSGLSEKSVTLIYNSTVYYGLWGIFSALSFTMFSAIPLFGLFMWLILTLVYSLGFFETTWNVGSN